MDSKMYRNRVSNGNPLQEVETQKYLVIVFEKELKWRALDAV